MLGQNSKHTVRHTKDKRHTDTHKKKPNWESWNTMPMSCHYMKDHCFLQLLFTYKCSRMWSKVHIFFPLWKKRHSLHAPTLVINSKRQKVITWFIKRLGTKSNRNAGWQFFFTSVYSFFLLFTQECRETLALCVVSQSWVFFLAFLPSFPCLTFFVLTTCTWKGKGDTGGLIHCQRHAKAIWAQNQTSGLLCLL